MSQLPAGLIQTLLPAASLGKTGVLKDGIVHRSQVRSLGRSCLSFLQLCSWATTPQATKLHIPHGTLSSLQTSLRLGFSGEVSVEELEQKL